MKNRGLVLVLMFAVSPLLARTINPPAGTAGGGASSRDPEMRVLSHVISPTHVPISIYGCGTPAIDGVLSPGEWSGAIPEFITINSPAGPVTGTLYMMNDNLNLYIAFRFPESVANLGSLAVEFDNNNNGIGPEEGDDAVVANNQLGLFDDYRTTAPAPCSPTSPCGPPDISAGGTNDGKMAYHNDGGYSVYEISHPLNSGDVGHDFALSEGQTVGFFIETRIIDGAGNIYDTTYPGFGVYDRYIVSGCVPLAYGCGTPTLDGNISPGEWASSGQYRIAVRTPHRDWVPATVYVMNDSFNLYMAISFDQGPGLLNADDFHITFDVDGNNLTSAGDDHISFSTGIGFNDSVFYPCGGTVCGDVDVNRGGTNDGAGALGNSGTLTAFELSHPLNSGDADDFVLGYYPPNNTIGYSLFLRLIEPGGIFPDGFGDTTTVFKPLAVCTPGPSSSLVDLGRGVDQLASSSSLSSKNADTLRKDLSKANENLSAGKTKQAANALGNFISDVQKMIRKGDLSDRKAQPLIAAANLAISQL
jgi:FIMAH domain-containing protein